MAEPILLDGKALAAKIREDLKARVAKLDARPILATILVGDAPASATYVKMKGKACESIGMDSRRIELPASTQTDALLRIIDELNKDPTVHGILLQHPVHPRGDDAPDGLIHDSARRHARGGRGALADSR